MLDFTKGKWEYCEPLGVVFSEDTCAVIATVHGAGTGSCFNLSPEGQANARLIAAAPEMYKILCNIRDQLSEVDLDTDTEDDIHVILAYIDGKVASYD